MDTTSHRGSGGAQERWRWYARAYGSPPTIAISEPSAEQTAERERRIQDGAEVVPFGFARVLARQPKPEADPMLWEGSD